MLEQRVYVYTADALSMAKLYWRIKKNGKWTWTPAHVQETFPFKHMNGLIKQRYVVEEFEW